MLPYVVVLKNKESKSNIISSLKSLGVTQILEMGKSRYIRFDATAQQKNQFEELNRQHIQSLSIVRNENISSNFLENYDVYFDSIVAHVEDLPDGSHVDIVVIDLDDVVDNHNVFNEQLQYVDWYSFAEDGLFEGSYIPSSSSSSSSHGTMVASVCSSRQFGWTKNANLFSINLNQTYAGGISLGAELVLNWHNQKTTNPDTGTINPTIVVMSYGFQKQYRAVNQYTYTTSFQSSLDNLPDYIQSITYRGTDYTYNEFTNIVDFFSSKGIMLRLYGDDDISNVNDYIETVLLPSNPSDAVIDQYKDLANADNLICISSAGNSSTKNVEPSHIDYNNKFTFVDSYTLINGNNVAQTDEVFYARQTIPTLYSISVGALSNSADRSKAVFSNCGNAVDVYAPGQGIMVYNGSNNLSVNGTSFAAPNVAGMLACYISDSANLSNIDISTSGARAWLINNSLPTMLERYDENNPQDSKSIQATSEFNRVAHMPNINTYSCLATPTLAFPLPNIVLENNDVHEVSKLDGPLILELENLKEFVSTSGDWIASSKTISCASTDRSDDEKFAILDMPSIFDDNEVTIESRILLNRSWDNTPTSLGALFRYSDIDNTYLIKFTKTSYRNIDIELIRRVSGTETLLGSSRIANHDAVDFHVRYRNEVDNSITIDIHTWSTVSRSWSRAFTFSGQESVVSDGKVGLYYQNTSVDQSVSPAVNSFTSFKITKG